MSRCLCVRVNYIISARGFPRRYFNPLSSEITVAAECRPSEVCSGERFVVVSRGSARAIRPDRTTRSDLYTVVRVVVKIG